MSQMQHAMRTYDVVIVDTPAGDVGGDARSIAHATRGALLVARKDRTRLDVVRKMTEDLRGASVEVLGALVNEK
jgi:protein-tyrosine kinase